MSRKQLTCNSCVFYGSFYEAVSLLPLESQGKVYDAIFKFAFENIETELEGVELAVFLLIKPQLIANRTKYENGCKGGRPKKETDEQKVDENGEYLKNNSNSNNQNESKNKPNNNQDKSKIKPNQNQSETKTKPNNNLSITETKPNVNDNDNVNENVNDNVNVNENGSSITTRKRFVRPTLDEVKQYCVERHNSVDAQRFMDFYTSKGWLVGNQPMKDWKAAIRTWEQRENNSSGGVKVAMASKYDREE